MASYSNNAKEASNNHTNTTFMHWSALNTLLSTHLSASDSTALRGDLVHQYGMSDTFAGMSLAAAQSAINDPQFGAQPQLLQPLAGLQGGRVSLFQFLRKGSILKNVVARS